MREHAGHIAPGFDLNDVEFTRDALNGDQQFCLATRGAKLRREREIAYARAKLDDATASWPQVVQRVAPDRKQARRAIDRPQLAVRAEREQGRRHCLDERLQLFGLLSMPDLAHGAVR